MQKIILGSAQIGMKYGINNKIGQIQKTDAFKILDFAFEKGIREIDTASGYGNAEQIIGRYLKTNKTRFRIITKCSGKNSREINKEIKESLSKLKVKKIYGILIHRFDSYKKNHEVYQALIDLKRKKIVDKIGFSLYYPKEAEYLLKHKESIDILEIPYNLFDRRFEALFEELKRKKIKIYARSVFLQGLFFKKEKELNGFFERVRKRIKSVNIIARKNRISLSAVCLNFVLLNKNIDKILIGVDSLDNLSENVEVLKELSKVKKIYSDLCVLKFNDEKIILPINWPKI